MSGTSNLNSAPPERFSANSSNSNNNSGPQDGCVPGTDITDRLRQTRPPWPGFETGRSGQRPPELHRLSGFPPRDQSATAMRVKRQTGSLPPLPVGFGRATNTDTAPHRNLGPIDLLGSNGGGNDDMTRLPTPLTPDVRVIPATPARAETGRVPSEQHRRAISLEDSTLRPATPAGVHGDMGRWLECLARRDGDKGKDEGGDEDKDKEKGAGRSIW